SRSLPNATRPTFANIPEPGTQGAPHHDVFDWLLARPSLAERRTGHPGPNVLQEDASFVDQHAGSGTETAGIGTWLGHESALVFDAQAGRIYVGSADGIVSRLRWAGETPSHPHPTRLVLDGQCRTSPSAPLSLGFGVRGLAEKGNHLFVATHRRIYRFDKSSLDNATGTMLKVDLSWDESRPRHLRVVDLWDDGTDYLVYTTFYGELVVRDLNLNVVARWSEPGIRDLEIGGGTTSDDWSVPLWILSERGHVVAIEIGRDVSGDPDQVPADVRVIAASAVQEGDPMSLYRESDGRIIGLWRHPRWGAPTNPIPDTVREFDTTLNRLSAQTNIGNQFGGVAGDVGWNTAAQIEKFGNDFVTLNGGVLHYLDRSIPINEEDPPLYGYTAHSSPIHEFVAAYHPTAMAVGDVDGDGQEDVVLATQDGLVVWVPHGDVVQGSLATVTAALAQDVHAYSSAGIVATWGITFGGNKIQVIDQTSRRWEIAVDGSAGYRGLPVHTRQKPFRDLGYVRHRPLEQ